MAGCRKFVYTGLVPRATRNGMACCTLPNSASLAVPLSTENRSQAVELSMWWPNYAYSTFCRAAWSFAVDTFDRADFAGLEVTQLIAFVHAFADAGIAPEVVGICLVGAAGENQDK